MLILFPEPGDLEAEGGEEEAGERVDVPRPRNRALRPQRRALQIQELPRFAAVGRRDTGFDNTSREARSDCAWPDCCTPPTHATPQRCRLTTPAHAMRSPQLAVG